MISGLSLLNFKSFLDQRIEFGKVTLLTGLNGGGKSTVIQALLALRQSHREGMLDRGGATQLALNGTCVRLGAGSDVFNMFAHGPDIISIGLEYDTGETAKWSFDYEMDADILTGRLDEAVGNIWSAPPLAPRTRSSLQALTTEYVSADRIGPRPSFDLADYDIGSQGVGSRGEFTVHFLSSFGTQAIPIPELARHQSGDAQSSLQLIYQVGAWLDLVSPGVRLAARADRGLDLARLAYTFSAGTYGETNAFRATNVGFGLTYSLPMLTALLGAAPGSLLIFENPEAHLHPKGHFEFALLIARAAAHGVQIIVESHSDHVLNGIRVAVYEGILKPSDVRIQFFDRGGELPVSRARSLKLDAAGGIDDWPESFFDEWDNALSRLLGD